MKRFPIIIAFLLCLLAMAACHKDKEMDIKEAIVSHEEIMVSATQARLSWQVDFVGQFQTGVELSQNENMSDLRRVGATKEEDGFVAVVDSLSVGKKYYYRIVVWNKFGSYEQPLGDFTTSKTFSVHVSAEPSLGGTVAGGGTFAEGDTCTVVATANEGYNFVNWTENGTQASADSIYQFAVTNNRNLVAHFTSQEYTITAIAEPSEGGTVDGSGGYNNGDECTLTATANDGYDFVNWTKEDGTQVSTNTTYRFMVTETATYIAHFQVKSYTVNVSANPAEGGSVEGDGTYQYGQSCTVRATKATGYHFVNWTENGGQVSANEVYTFTVTGDRDLVANFTSQDYDIRVVEIVPENGGTVEGAGGYDYNRECTLKAIPAEGFSFVKWTEGDHEIMDNPYTFRVTESHDFVAHFQVQSFSITVSANPVDGGSVYIGNNQGTTQDTFNSGQYCLVRAIANSGYRLVNWTENDSVVSNVSAFGFYVSNDRVLVANFTRIYTIDVSANPSDGGTVSGGGVYQQGQSCEVTATAKPNYTFLNWMEGSQVVSTEAEYSFTVTGDRTLVAHFEPQQCIITVSADPTNGGSVHVGSPTGPTTGTFNSGQSCSLYATANSGYTFTNWKKGNNVVSTNSTYTFIVTESASYTATFTAIPQYTITTHVNPAGSGTVSGGGPYYENTNCTLTATPSNNNYTFDHWTRNGTTISGGATISFTVTANATYVAYFTSNSGNHAYVDLGLPSGLLWATCNVGADNPEDYGYYFAWGETTPKDTYNWSTYQYYDGSSVTKYTGNDGLTTLLPEDDAATAQWGSGWRMPTREEWNELLNNTTNTWTTQNGVNGRRFTATNGNSLFLPAAGYRNEGSLYGAGGYGRCWSSSLYTDYPNYACHLIFYSGYCLMNNDDRYYGQSVRPVRSSGQN